MMYVHAMSYDKDTAMRLYMSAVVGSRIAVDCLGRKSVFVWRGRVRGKGRGRVRGRERERKGE